LHTCCEAESAAAAQTRAVTLFTLNTEIGTLEIYCVARDGNNRWRLEFNVRELVKDVRKDDDEGVNEALTDVWPESQVRKAAKLIEVASRDGVTVRRRKNSPRHWKAALEAGRDKWPTGLCRRLWISFRRSPRIAAVRRSNDAVFHLVGFCLRPGFGDSLDKFRVEQLWKMMHAVRKDPASGRPLPPQPDGGADAWIMWRRVAAG